MSSWLPTHTSRSSRTDSDTGPLPLTGTRHHGVEAASGRPDMTTSSSVGSSGERT